MNEDQAEFSRSLFDIGNRWLAYPTRLLELLALKAFFGFAAFRSQSFIIEGIALVADFVLLGFLLLPLVIYVIPRFELNKPTLSGSYLSRAALFLLLIGVVTMIGFVLGMAVTELAVVQLA